METPFDDIIEYIRIGDINKAKEEMEVDSGKFSDSDFINAVNKLESGWKEHILNKHRDADISFADGLSIFNGVTDSFLIDFTRIIATYDKGVVKLHDGDAYGAYELIKSSYDEMDELSILSDDFKKHALLIKADSIGALVRIALHSNDLDEAKLLIGNMNQVLSELLNYTDDNNEQDIAILAKIYGTKLETSLFFMRLDLEVIDFRSLKLGLINTKESYDKLKLLFPKLLPTQIKKAFQIDQYLYLMFDLFCIVGFKIINKKQYLSKAELIELDKSYELLINMDNIANEAGDTGKHYRIIINKFRRLRVQLLHIGQNNTKKDFGVLSGIISFVAFVIANLLAYSFYSPSGEESIKFFFGSLCMGLIVGFGYGALRFLPLINSFSRAVKDKDQ